MSESDAACLVVAVRREPIRVIRVILDTPSERIGTPNLLHGLNSLHVLDQLVFKDGTHPHIDLDSLVYSAAPHTRVHLSRKVVFWLNGM